MRSWVGLPCPPFLPPREICTDAYSAALAISVVPFSSRHMLIALRLPGPLCVQHFATLYLHQARLGLLLRIAMCDGGVYLLQASRVMRRLGEAVRFIGARPRDDEFYEPDAFLPPPSQLHRDMVLPVLQVSACTSSPPLLSIQTRKSLRLYSCILCMLCRTIDAAGTNQSSMKGICVRPCLSWKRLTLSLNLPAAAGDHIARGDTLQAGRGPVGGGAICSQPQ